MLVDTTGIPKAMLLAGLFNVARSKNPFTAPLPAMTMDEAESIISLRGRNDDLDEPDFFDYCRGVSLKVDIGGDLLETEDYDRDYGPGAAEAVVSHLRRDLR